MANDSIQSEPLFIPVVGFREERLHGCVAVQVHNDAVANQVFDVRGPGCLMWVIKPVLAAIPAEPYVVLTLSVRRQ